MSPQAGLAVIKATSIKVAAQSKSASQMGKKKTKKSLQ